MSVLSKALKAAFGALKLMLFPKRCALCGNVIEFDSYICDDCRHASRPEMPVCIKCGCSKAECICKKSPKKPEYKAVIAPFYYENSVSRGILNMKMNDMPRLAAGQGKEISKAVKKLYELIEFDCVTYIPMSFYSEKYRGYNQSELLAREVSARCGIRLERLLVKKRKTKLQKRQNAQNRFVNMYNAFDLAENADLSGKTILLIDDVKTTGATLSSASLTLKAHGAKAVYCAVTAIVK